MRYLHSIPGCLMIGTYFVFLIVKGMNLATGITCVGAGIALGIIAGRLLVKSYHRQLFHRESTILSRRPPGGFLTILLCIVVLAVIMVLGIWLLALFGRISIVPRIGVVAFSTLTTTFTIAGVYIYLIERRVGARVFQELDRLHFDNEEAEST